MEERCSRWAQKHLRSISPAYTQGSLACVGLKMTSPRGRRHSILERGMLPQSTGASGGPVSMEVRRRSHPGVPGITGSELQQRLLLQVGTLSCSQTCSFPPTLDPGPPPPSSNPPCGLPLAQCSSAAAQACRPREEPPAAYTQTQTLPCFPNPKGWRHQRLIVNRQDPERTLCRGPLGHRQPSLGPKERGLTCQPTRCMCLCWGAQGYGILRHGHTDLSGHGPCSLATVVSLPQVPPPGRPPRAVQHGKHLSTHNGVG